MALLELKHISKSFGQNQVLRDVNFELRPGEVHALDIVNIGLHFILKNVRPYAAPCSEA